MLAAVASLFALPCSAQNAASELETPSVEVVATMPLPGVGTPLSQVPSNVQTFTERTLAGRQTLHVADQLQRQATSVSINEGQGNPYQPDLNFRGFTASPLLGTPQGLSVFQDGVRINEGFGDIVNWDLLPRSAIAGVSLLPGSNAVFGLNTLGGALSITTKSGFQYPGAALRASAGANGRRVAELEWGGHGADKDYFLAADSVRDGGWREHQSSQINRLFAKFGHQDEKDDIDLSITAADNKLDGAQTLPQSMLGNPRLAYTWPDSTRNQLLFLNLKGSRAVDDERLVVGNVYYRDLDSSSFSSNINDACNPGPCAFNSFNNLIRVKDSRLGASLQLTLLGDLGTRRNQFTTGLALDSGEARFNGQQQNAVLTTGRGSAGVSDFIQTAGVRALHDSANLYLSDTLSFTEALHLTTSASYNVVRISIADQTGTTSALNAAHRFSGLNPALGLAFSPSVMQTWFAGFSQGMRAPTPMELTCADPAAPCRLPNIFLADPPLKPVISHTLEVGTRQKFAGDLRMSLALFRTGLRDDIQFISSGGAALNAGYFQNIGQTRREGVEFGLDRKFAELSLGLHYSLTDATYRSAFKAHSPNNSSQDAAGDIQVSPGNRIPGIPRQSLKLSVDYEIARRARLGADLVAYSGQFARGNENNQDRNGALPGYAVVNLDADYRIEPGLRVFASIANLFDRRYASFGVLGANFFIAPGNGFDPANVRAEQFRSPGAPRSFWIGVEYAFGAIRQP